MGDFSLGWLCAQVVCHAPEQPESQDGALVGEGADGATEARDRLVRKHNVLFSERKKQV